MAAAPTATPDIDEQTRTRPTTPWNVIVWDDPVTPMPYVVKVFMQLFGWGRAKAEEKMWEVHNDGKSVVASCTREQAENYVLALHRKLLHATMERS